MKELNIPPVIYRCEGCGITGMRPDKKKLHESINYKCTAPYFTRWVAVQHVHGYMLSKICSKLQGLGMAVAELTVMKGLLDEPDV